MRAGVIPSIPKLSRYCSSTVLEKWRRVFVIPGGRADQQIAVR